ncbi:MAG: DUF4240 domain-containing protein [Sporichthyaceae bacterium]
MSTDAMWGLIDRARSEAAEPAKVASRLVEVLAEQDPTFILATDQAMRETMAAAYGWPLWGAAYLINGGCSDDGFDYFLAGLLGTGRANFEAAVADPDSLADLDDATLQAACDGEDVLAAPYRAYERATDEELPIGGHVPRSELGAEWDFDDAAEMSARYPRLWERFGAADSGASAEG